LEGQAVHPQVRWVLSSQLAVTLIATLLALVLQGVDAGISAMLGGGIAVVSGFVYVWRAMRGAEISALDAKKAFQAQVAGEGYKFAVTFLLFALVFKSYGQLAALPLFLAYAATIVVYWIALLRRR
jgi:F0F1-type ATP synthase assembly protein I